MLNRILYHDHVKLWLILNPWFNPRIQVWLHIRKPINIITWLTCKRRKLYNFICQVEWTITWPVPWLNIVLGMSVRVFLDKINIWIIRLNKAVALPQFDWVSINPLKTRLALKLSKRVASHWCLCGNISFLLHLNFELYGNLDCWCFCFIGLHNCMWWLLKIITF